MPSVVLSLLLIFIQQEGVAQRKSAEAPVCAKDAICFAGEVLNGEEFRRPVSANLEFVLSPGWTIEIAPTHPQKGCDEFASVANAPYRAHRQTDIDATYEWTAEDEVRISPREFHFVTNCEDLKTESDRLNKVLWGYGVPEKDYNDALAKLGTLATGKGRLWITDARVSHRNDTPDNNHGTIEWMKFSVEIVLPKESP